ncbi:hypothetical protein ACOMHN_008567 [Nucella lapillus]
MYCSAVREGGHDVWEFVYRGYRAEGDPTETDRLRSALGCSRDPAVLYTFLDLCLYAEEVPPSQTPSCLTAVAANRHGRDVALNFLMDNFPQLRHRFSTKSLSSMVETVTQHFHTHFHLSQLRHLRQTYDVSGLEAALDAVRQRTLTSMTWVSRNTDTVRAWLQGKVPEPTSTAAELDYRLPTAVTPYHYDLELQLDIYGPDPAAFTFSGRVSVWVEVGEATSSITLHAHLLDHDTLKTSARLFFLNGTDTGYIRNVTFDPPRHFLSLALDQDLRVTERFRLYLEFRAALTESGVGLFYASYLGEDGSPVYLAGSQFEKVSARRAFPCFDEPALKASVNVTLVRKESHHGRKYRAWSNNRLWRTEDRGGGYKADHFLTTPPTSTYLFAFLVADFQCLTNTTKHGLTYSTCARPEVYQQAELAHDWGMRAMEWLEDRFDPPYPMAKLEDRFNPPYPMAKLGQWVWVCVCVRVMEWLEDHFDPPYPMAKLEDRFDPPYPMAKLGQWVWVCVCVRVMEWLEDHFDPPYPMAKLEDRFDPPYHMAKLGQWVWVCVCVRVMEWLEDHFDPPYPMAKLEDRFDPPYPMAKLGQWVWVCVCVRVMEWLEDHFDPPYPMAKLEDRVDPPYPMAKLGQWVWVCVCVRVMEWLEDHFDPPYPMAKLEDRFDPPYPMAKLGQWVWVCVCVRVMEWLEDHFDPPYPMAKLDNMIVPHMRIDAMGNWGLATYRELALFQEGVTPAANKAWTLSVVARELAHMWFGNLVTPRWWTWIWLKEGQASFWHLALLDSLLPRWRMADQFAVDYVHVAMRLDSVTSSYPLSADIRDPSDIPSLWASLNYCKGASVFRMMDFVMGREHYIDGLNGYLSDHQYGVTNDTQLFASLDQYRVQQGQGRLMSEVMDAWVTQMGFPVVHVHWLTAGQVTLTQQRFLTIGNEEDESSDQAAFGYTWDIPITMATSDNPNFNVTGSDITWFNKSDPQLTITSATIPAPPTQGERSGWVVINVRQYGLYRVSYPTQNWLALIQQLKADPSVIHPVNRAQIIDDAWSLARSGQLSVMTALHTLQVVKNDPDFVPWEALSAELRYLDLMLSGKDVYGVFEDYLAGLVNRTYHAVGMSSHPDEPPVLTRHRQRVVGYACKYGLHTCRRQATRLFHSWKLDPHNNSLEVDLRGIILCHGVRWGDRGDWEFVYRRYVTTGGPGSQGGTDLLTALTCSSAPWLLHRLMTLTLNSTLIKASDIQEVMQSVSLNPIGRHMAFTFLQHHFRQFTTLMGASRVGSMVVAVTKHFNTRHELDQVKRFMSQNDVSVAVTSFRQVLKDTSVNLKWMTDNYHQVRHYLKNPSHW